VGFIQHLPEPGRHTRRCSGATVGDSPEGPLKTGGILLKTCKKQKKTHLSLKRTHRARPTLRWPPRPTRVAQSKAPSSGFRLARGPMPPRVSSASLEGSRLPRAGSASLKGSRLPRAGSASLEDSRLPRAGSASLEGSPPPRLRLPHEHACSRMRVRAFNALTRQSRAITRLGITSRRYSANSLGETHPRHCRELCGMAGVSPAALCCPLLYG
jgi:hypothetical protein